MAAVVHHGGAGTTAAGLRAGRPSIVSPFFGDQPFWGQRVHALGAGPEPLRQRDLTAETLAGRIRTALNEPSIRKAAAALGETLRAEDGVANAVAFVERLRGSG
jgi:sterol 3beta-glucosyltransferase